MNTISSMLHLSALKSSSPAELQGRAARLRSTSAALHQPRVDELAQGIERARQYLEAQQQRRNLSDQISLSQVAEGALSSITDPLLALHEVTVRGASDLLATQDREHLQRRADVLVDEIERVFSSARFQGSRIFDGFQLTGGSDEMTIPGLNFNELFTHTGVDRSEDHDVVFVIDSSKSTNPEISEILDKINQYAQSYGDAAGSLSVGVVFTPIRLNGGGGEVGASAHPLVNLSDEGSEDEIRSLERFLDEQEPQVGQIRFKEAIEYATDEFAWRDEAHRSLVLIGSNGGEGIQTGVVDAVERFVERDRSAVSGIGLVERNHPTSTFFRDSVVPVGGGVYETYSSDLEVAEVAAQSRAQTRVVSGINLSTTLTARESQDVVLALFDEVTQARSSLGAQQTSLEARIAVESERASQIVKREDQIKSERLARAIAERTRDELSVSRHLRYHTRATQYFGAQLLNLVTLATR